MLRYNSHSHSWSYDAVIHVIVQIEFYYYLGIFSVESRYTETDELISSTRYKNLGAPISTKITSKFVEAKYSK